MTKAYAKENGIKDEKDLDKQFKADMAACFQEAVVSVLAKKLMRAVSQNPDVKEIHLAGGVSANLRLRELVREKSPKNLKFRCPVSIEYCTDNAAMIASAAFYLYKTTPADFKISSNIIPLTSFEIF
jgi:N6-L-threonylcarbamoyladenine synthase